MQGYIHEIYVTKRLCKIRTKFVTIGEKLKPCEHAVNERRGAFLTQKSEVKRRFIFETQSI